MPIKELYKQGQTICSLILDSAADGMFTVDKEWTILAFNRAAERITGWSKDEVIGQKCYDIFKSSVCGENCLLANSVDSQVIDVDRQIFIKRKDGLSIPVSISVAPLLDASGKVIGGVETFRDVTKQMELQLILDSIADGVFTVDRHFQITSFNKAAEIITGYTAQQAIGQDCHSIFRSSICGPECAIAACIHKKGSITNKSIIIKNIDGEDIPISISASPLIDHEGHVFGGVETFRDISSITALKRELTKSYTFGDIISKSPSMQRIFSILPNIARSDSNVLVLGESGTGKELIARAVHNYSTRAKKPFVAVNCGALPDTLLESELFGYKAGAFTDAKKDRPGRFAAAEGGTLFLDEIGDISQAVQVKLLRVLQSRVYEPLGSNEPVKANVRILAATNKDLQQLVAEERFREDLYYRLNVVKINLPPLKERKQDIPLLIDHFVRKFRLQNPDSPIKGMSDASINILMHYNFPGNVRELENIIEYAFIMCREPFIEPEHLPEPFNMKKEEELELQFNQPLSLAEIEKRGIYRALERNHWRRMATCRELGISKDTLRRKIQQYGIEIPLDIEE